MNNIEMLKKINKSESDIVELNEQLDTIETQKADKTTVWTMANMGQDVKEAMTGGSVAVVGKLGTNICNLANDTLNILGEFIQVALPINNGFYPNNSNELSTSGNYINMRTTCTPN